MKARSATAGPRRRPTVDEADNLLPQTQCGQCGYPGCRPYAQAMLDEGADINRCPPGGALTLQALAALLERPVLPLDPGCGETKPPQVVEIEEAACIGCTKCIQACPVDAIVGAAKRMHTVIAAECTGCELCIPPCPVDCIVIKPLAVAAADMTAGSRLRLAMERRARYQARQRRLNLPSSLSDGENRRRRIAPADTGAAEASGDSTGENDRAAMQAEIQAAIARVRAKRRQASIKRPDPR